MISFFKKKGPKVTCENNTHTICCVLFSKSSIYGAYSVNKLSTAFSTVESAKNGGFFAF